MNPTDQQVEAIALFRLGLTLRLEAGAGTGKTSTLEQMARSTRRVGQYCAFNRDIVHDAALRMPENLGCATAHSLAFRQVGRKYAHRLDSPRMKSADVARRLGLSHLVCRYGSETKVLQPGYLAGLVQRTVVRFCQTADPVPTIEHVPYVDGIDGPEPSGARGWANNRRVREHVAPALARCWSDICDPAGDLRFSHDHYLKVWQLGLHGKCRIPGDFILFDEAQDASPVMLDALMQQDAQLVVVGDSQQQIYEWRGAINALAQVPAEATAYLSRSFRFGPEIADVANLVLEQLDAELRLEGAGGPSSVRPIAGEPDCVLTRTNAEAVTTVLRYQADGVRVHLVGGGEEVASFAKGVQSLEETGWTAHPELACFDSWQEVRDYVSQDPQGGELKLLVKLVVEFGVDVILKALDHMPAQETAQVVVSTAHRSKGREWGRVRLAGDFPPLPDSSGEWRLAYVAATRAATTLDMEACAPLALLLDPDPDERRLPIELPGPGHVEDLDDELDLGPDDPPDTEDDLRGIREGLDQLGQG